MSQFHEQCSIYKIVVIGESNCGKSNIILRYCKNEFEEVSRPTIGVEFFQKDVKVMNTKKVFENIKLQIWDTAGQERFRGMANSYYRKSAGVILVFDLTNSISFQNLEKWISEINSYCDGIVDIILVGNKKDMASSREVKQEEAEEFARKHNFPYFETSAKVNTDQGIEHAFLDLAHRIHQRCNRIDQTETLANDVIERKNQQTINLDKKNKRARANCC